MTSLKRPPTIESDPVMPGVEEFGPTSFMDRPKDQLLGAMAASLAVLAVAAPVPKVFAAEHKTSPQPASCRTDKQIIFALSDAKLNSNPDVHKYKIVAEACHRTSPKVLKNVRLVEKTTGQHKKTWKFKQFESGSQHERYFSLPSQSLSRSRLIEAKAVNRRGKRLGAAKWLLNPVVKSRRPQTGSTLDTATTYAQLPDCTPDPDFQVGIQDDNQFVWQQNVDRGEALSFASNLLGAKILRINVVYGQEKAYGDQQYIDTVDAAIAAGYKVQATLMPTPKYMPLGDQTLNYQNLNPQLTQDFARHMATVFGPKVMTYAIDNEPNILPFSDPPTLEHYLPSERAGYAGIKEVNPQAKVLAGELAPSASEDDWLTGLQAAPADGDAIHPYGDAINHLDEYRVAAGRDLYVSEYGVPASDPDQWDKDQAAITKARCAGAKELVFFQLFRIPGKNWNTGIIDLPTSRQSLESNLRGFRVNLSTPARQLSRQA